MELLIQSCVTIAIAIVEYFLNNKMTKSFNKEAYCRNYLHNQQIIKQRNEVNTGSIHNSNINIKQSNTSIVNNCTIKTSNNTSSDNTNIMIFYLIIGITLIVLFVLSYGYLKYILNFDYWYPLLLFILGGVSLFLYNMNYKKNGDLYWERKQHFASIAFLFILLLLFTLYLFRDNVPVELLRQLEGISRSNVDFITKMTSTFHIFKSDNIQMFYFLFKVILIFTPLAFLCMDIYSQIKYKKPFLNILIITIVVAILIGFPQFIFALNK